MSAYAMRHGVEFGEIRFLSAARQSLRHNLDEARSLAKALGAEKEDQRKELEGRLDELETRLRQMDDAQGELRTLTKQLTEERKRSDAPEEENSALRTAREQETETLRLTLEKERREHEMLIDWYKRRLEWPRRSADVAEWAKRVFAGRVIFLSRAENEIKSENLDPGNQEILCSALDYLATDYWDGVFGGVSAEELEARARPKYGGAAYEVGYSNRASMERFPQEYQVPYGGDGRTAELSLHLKATGKNVKLRIYFLLDTDRKLLVVGSLPKHLSTAKYGKA